MTVEWLEDRAVPDATYHNLADSNFTQNWTNPALITTNDEWGGVPSIIGYRGDDLTTATGVDPQTILADGTGVIDVNANQTNPDAFSTGGVTEFAITNPVVALTGSGTADAPFLLLHLNTTGVSNVTVSFNLRDLDGSADNAIQPVAVQYRIGPSGNFTNLPAGFVADATTGPSAATQVTPIAVTLPAAADNQAQVQVRIITTNAVGNDEWVGIDDIVVSTPAFVAGNIAVLQVDENDTNSSASIVELNTTTANQNQSDSIPIDATGTNALRLSGSVTTTGYLSRTNDGTLLTFTGANSTDTTANVNTLNPRAVGTVNPSGAYGIAATYTGTSGDQTRSATSLNNTTWFIADQGGIYTNEATAPSPTGNFRGIKSFGGVVYVGLQSSTATAIQVSTVSAPNGGTVTGLPGLANHANFQDFYLIRSGDNGAAYDVLYTTYNTAANAGTVAKFSLVDTNSNGTLGDSGDLWTANGTYSTNFGGFGLAAADNGNGALLYVSTGTGATNNNSVLKLADTAGYNAAINITTANNVTLYTAAPGKIIKGVDFTPGTTPPAVEFDDGDADDSVTVGAVLTYTVRFSETVTGVDVSDFEIASGSTATGTIGGFSAVDGDTYTVQVTTTGVGDLKLGIKAGVTIEDAAGNDLSVPVADDTTVTVVAAGNDAPVVTLPGGAVSYTEKDPATVIDPGATVTDDSANFDTGTLTVDYTDGGTADDRLEIRNQGTGAGQIGVSGPDVTFGGTVIGTFTGGSGTTPLVVTFDADATPAAAEALVKNVTYRNASHAPATAARTVRFVLTDGDGGTSDPKTQTVNVTAVNDAPTFTATGGTPTFTEGGSAAPLFSGAAAGTVEAGQDIDTLVLTISGVADTSEEFLLIDGTDVPVTFNSTVTTATNGLTVAVVLDAAGTTATVTITRPAAGFATSIAESLTNALAYSNTSNNPTAGSRVVTFTSITDTGGTANSGSDTTSLSVAGTVTVVAVNAAPVLEGADNFAPINEDATTNSGTPVSLLVVEKIVDTDGPARGIAITATVGTNGTWEFTTNGGTNWTAVGPVSDASALLLTTDTETRVRFVPDANFNGTVSNAVTFRAWDTSTGTAGTKVDTSTNGGDTAFSTDTKSSSITVDSVNDAPAGTDNTVSTSLNTAYTFTVADFGLTDPNDTPANGLMAVRITTLPTAGALTNNETAVNAGDFISVADITAGNLRFTPTTGEFGSPYATFTFQVQDNGGTTNSGVDLDPSADTVTINVAANQPPVVTLPGGVVSYTENAPRVVVDANLTLTDDGSTITGAVVRVTTGFVAFQDELSFTPLGNLGGVYVFSTGVLTLFGTNTVANYLTALRSVTFRANGENPTPGDRTITFTATDGDGETSAAATKTVTVTAVNDAPSGADKTVTTNEDTAYTFAVADFGFTDPDDAPADAFAGVVVATLPATGVLALSGIAVTAGQFVTAADIAAGNLRFTPAENANGPANATFTFQVRDTGSASNGGAFTDPTANTITVDVTAVNDPPTVTLVAEAVGVSQGTTQFSQDNFATFAPGGGADEVGQTPTYLVTSNNTALFSVQPAIDANGTLTFTVAPGASGTATVTVTATDGAPPAGATSDPKTFAVSVFATAVASPSAPAGVSVSVSPQLIAIGSDAGVPGQVRVLNAATGAVVREFFPFGGFIGGVRVAVADMTGDGVDDIVVATASFIGAVGVFDGVTGQMVNFYLPFGLFPSGVQIATGDLDGDGRQDLVIGLDSGAPLVYAINGRTGAVMRVFNAIPGFAGGLRLAVGDFTGDGKADIVTVAGPGGNGLTIVYDGVTGGVAGAFFTFPGLTSEINVSMGDVTGDGLAELVAGVQVFGGTFVGAFDRSGQLVRSYTVPNALIGTARVGQSVVANQAARIALADLTGDRIADLLIADPPGTFGSKMVLVNGATGDIIDEQLAFDPLFGFGAFVDVN